MTLHSGNFSAVLGERPGGVTLANMSFPRWRRFGYCKERLPVRVTPAYVQGLHLTVRDNAIAAYLAEAGYATTGQIARLFYGQTKKPLKKAQERLTWLWRMHVVDRTIAELTEYGIPLQLVYTLGAAGVFLLSDPDSGIRARPRRGNFLLAHNVLLGEAIAGLVETGQTQGWTLRYHGERGAYSSFQWDNRWVKLRPDGLLYLMHTLAGVERPFFVEMDTGNESVGAYATKVLQYEWYYRSEAWRERGDRFPGVLIVAWAKDRDGDRRKALAEARLRALIEQVRVRRRDYGVHWFFASLDIAGSGHWLALDRQGKTREINVFTLPRADAGVGAGEISAGGTVENTM